MHDNAQLNHDVDSHADHTSDSNMIPYDKYVKDNAVSVVHSNVSSVPNDAFMMIYNDMYEPHAQSVSNISRNTVVENSLTAKIGTYKEQVELYERQAKFELTEREQKINEQLRLVISDRNFKEETLKKELHCIKLQLASTINHNKLMVEEVTFIKKDFKQKENKYLEDFLDMKSLKEKVEDRLLKQDQSLQTVHMLCRPKPYYNELNKGAIGYKNPLCLTRTKQVHHALYNGHKIIKDNHVLAIVHNTEDTLEIAEITRKKMNDKDPECVTRKVKIAPHDYSKENFLATFTPQKQLTPEKIFWSQDLINLKSEALKEQTTVSRPIKALTVITPTGLTEWERGFKQTKECYLKKVIPFFKTLKDNFKGIQKALTKEIKEMKDVFEELEAEVAQNVVDRKHDVIEQKNLFIANDNLIAECLSKEVLFVATNSELDVARFTEMHVANTIVEARCLALEAELANLRDKNSFRNNLPTPDKDTSDFDSVFVIGKMEASLQGKDNVIRQLKKQISQLQETRSDTDRTLKNNRDTHLDYLRYLTKSVETIRDIVEEDKVVRPLDRSIVSARRYTKHSEELLEYGIGTCPFLRCIDTRPNGEALRKCILSGPYRPTNVLVQAIEATDDSPAIPEHTTVETPMNMSPENKAHFLAEKEAIHVILTGIGNEIYSTVDACQTAQEMWEAIERLQQETMESYYTRFHKLMNEMIRNNLTVSTMQVNVQFLQQLQPEWSRIVAIIKKQHKLDEVSYHKLLDILKQYQNKVNELRAKRLAWNANPLALVATAQTDQHQYYQTSRSHGSSAPSSKPSIPTRSHTATRHKGKEIAKPITPPSETTSEEDSNPEEAQRDKDMQKNLALIAKYFKKIYKPTNNNLKTSSNSKNKNVDTTLQFKNDRQSGQFGNQRTVNVARAREKLGSPVVQQSRIQCFNCKEFRYFAKECRKPKKVKDSTYHKEKMLLCKQAEQGVPLQAEEYDWLADTDEEVDEQELEAHYNYMARSGESDDEHVALANLKLYVDENKKIQKKLKKANTTLAQELKECKAIFVETSKSLGESISV
uniref:CCHC-type domain-containing protein n=1 Tax=Tanacetum cinerariifolium TaxID=118510 RepID=A0A6L2LJF1_TANCI|nr:hypothetical protein [Tanacetum cinerariifolium]